MNNTKINQKINDAFLSSVGEAHLNNIQSDSTTNEDLAMDEMNQWFNEFNHSYTKKLKWDRRKVNFQKLSKVAAAVVIAGMIGFTGLFAGVEAFRIEILNFMLFDQNTHTLVENSNHTELIDLGVTLPTMLPEGMKLYSYEQIGNMHKTIFRTDSEQFVSLVQANIETQIQFDTEGALVEKLEVNETEIIYIEKNGITSMYWERGNYNYSLVSNLSLEIIKNIIKSMK